MLSAFLKKIHGMAFTTKIKKKRYYQKYQFKFAIFATGSNICWHFSNVELTIHLSEDDTQKSPQNFRIASYDCTRNIIL